jgi:hypothetical protein
MSYEPPSSGFSVQRTLSEVKKDRKDFEQDSILLQNRLKFLQQEEHKTWNQIKKTQKMKNVIQEARKLKIDQNRKFSQALCFFEKQRLENHQKIQKLKENMFNNQIISRENLKRSKKEAYMEVRQLKGDILEMKVKNEQDYERENKKRSSSVKVEKIKSSIRKQQYRDFRLNQFREHYLGKIREELDKRNKIQSKILELESQETEIIRKLQNTQIIHQRIQADFESMRSHIPSKPLSIN